MGAGAWGFEGYISIYNGSFYDQSGLTYVSNVVLIHFVISHF